MALRRQVVDLVGLYLLDDANKAGAVGQITVVQEEVHVFFVPVAVEVVDAVSVEQAGAALDPVYFIAFVQQQLGQVSAILSGDAGDQSDFSCVGHG
jgi:hypothetical protein